MSYSISIKTEKAFAAWLPAALDIEGMNYYAGHEKAATVEFPMLQIYAEGSSPQPGFPTECGVRIVRLLCKFTADSDDSDRSEVDDWKQQLESVMTDDRQALQAALNKPAGTDARPIQGIHFHYVEMSDDPSDRSETDWIEDMAFNVICEPLDS